MNKLFACLIAMTLVGCVSPQKKNQIQNDFNHADALPFSAIESEKGEIFKEREWETSINLPNSENVKIHARSGFGFVRCIYPDDNVVSIFEYMDYLYVSDLRLSPDRSILYVQIDGLSPSFSADWRQRLIYVFDLLRRKTIFRIKESPPAAEK